MLRVRQGGADPSSGAMIWPIELMGKTRSHDDVDQVAATLLLHDQGRHGNKTLDAVLDV